MTIDGPPPTPPQTFTKICRRCSVQAETAATTCPNCGASYAGRRTPWRVIALIVALMLIIGGGLAGYLVVQNHRAATAAAQRAEDARAAAAAEAERQKEDAEAQQAAQAKKDDAERATRAAALTDLEATISADAKKDVSKGLLDGPILRTTCNPTNGGSTDDLTAITTAFDCLVVDHQDDDGTESGYGYSASINWNDGSYRWQYTG